MSKPVDEQATALVASIHQVRSGLRGFAASLRAELKQHNCCFTVGDDERCDVRGGDCRPWREQRWEWLRQIESAINGQNCEAALGALVAMDVDERTDAAASAALEQAHHE